MNYSDFINPKIIYEPNSDGTNYSTNLIATVLNNAKTILEIINYSQTLELWTTLNGPNWDSHGLLDLKFEENIIISGFLNLGNPCEIKFKLLKEDFKGQLEPDNNFKPQFIYLNSNLTYKNLTIPTWSQVLLMELGNYKNNDNFKELLKDKKIKREEFVRQWEKLEFDIRNQIIEAYIEKQFESSNFKSQECVFTENVSFEEYMKSDKNLKHRESIEKIWWNKDTK